MKKYLSQKKEKCDLYCAERVLFYFCTEGMNVKQSKLEKASRDKAKGKYKNLLRVNADRKLIHSG